MLDKLKSPEVLDNINFDILQYFDSYCWIAGGALTSVLMDETPKDIDIYFPSEADKIRAAAKILDAGGVFCVNYPNCIRVEYKSLIYDLVYLKPTVEETISSFDFTICGIAIDKFKKIFTVKNFEKDFKEKQLYHDGPDITLNKNAVNKCVRLLRYINKGFTINDKSLKMFLEQAIKDHGRK